MTGRTTSSLELSKALGQHHLLHPELCRPAVRFLSPAGRLVVEVGPGGGVLTGELLAAGARVAAWELDLGWAVELRRLLQGESLSVVVADAVGLPWGRLPPGSLAAGNLPFNVATRILTGLLLEGRDVERAAFLLQREVAERLLVPIGGRRLGALAVLASMRARVTALGRVRPGSFRPPPKVEGLFLALELCPPPVAWEELPALLATLQAAFGQRRKTIRNSLAAAWGREAAERALADAGLDPGARAELLSDAELLALFRAAVRHR